MDLTYDFFIRVVYRESLGLPLPAFQKWVAYMSKLEKLNTKRAELLEGFQQQKHH